MEEFTNQFGFIVYFLVLALILQMVFGNKMLYLFLWILLLSMVILNTRKLKEVIGGVSHD